MSRINYKTENKLKPVLIQGEARTGVLVSNLNFVQRRNPDGITAFTQIQSLNLAAARSWYRYTATLNSVKYRVYWRAVRDFDLEPSAPATSLTYFPQRVVFKRFDATGPEALPYTLVTAKEVPNSNPKQFAPNYDEVYLGEYTVSRYGPESVFLVSNTVTTVGLNSLVLDYIKLVPIIN